MSIDFGILLVRIVFGAAIAAHGSQKLFGAFGGYGLRGTGSYFESLGYRPGILFAVLAGVSELGGGVLLLLGLLTPIGAVMVLGTMIVAMGSVHWKNGFFAMNNGIELPFLYAAAALGIAFTGGGAYSLDNLIDLAFLGEPVVIGALLALTLMGTGVTLLLRLRPPQPTVATHS